MSTMHGKKGSETGWGGMGLGAYERGGAAVSKFQEMLVGASGGGATFASVMTNVQAGVDLTTDALIPAAEAAMRFGYSMQEGEGQAAAGLAMIAIHGKAIGRDFTQSFEDGNRIARSFNVSMDQADSIFVKQINTLGSLGLSYDDLTEAMGNSLEIGKAWGDQSKMYETVRGQVAPISGMETIGKERAKMFVSMATGFAQMPVSRMVGLAKGMAGMDQRKALEAISSSDDMAAFGMKLIRGSGKGPISGQLGGLWSGDIMKRWQGALAWSKILPSANPEAVEKMLLSSDKARNILKDMTTGTVSKERKEALDAELGKYDVTQKGLNFMGSQVNLLEQIAVGMQASVRLLGSLAMNLGDKSVGELAKQAAMGAVAITGKKVMGWLTHAIGLGGE
jgi:hypothetical protein